MTKSQINLPKTAFSMKANLPTREPEILEYWKKINLYDQLRKESNGREKFVLHDGPPYANGNIHMGTALNKILKDIIVKFHQMDGKDSIYVLHSFLNSTIGTSFLFFLFFLYCSSIFHSIGKPWQSHPGTYIESFPSI